MYFIDIDNRYLPSDTPEVVASFIETCFRVAETIECRLSNALDVLDPGDRAQVLGEIKYCTEAAHDLLDTLKLRQLKDAYLAYTAILMVYQRVEAYARYIGWHVIPEAQADIIKSFDKTCTEFYKVLN